MPRKEKKTKQRMKRKGGKRHETSGDCAWENRGKLTRRRHPDHTCGTQQTRHHFAINAPNTKQDVTKILKNRPFSCLGKHQMH